MFDVSLCSFAFCSVRSFGTVSTGIHTVSIPLSFISLKWIFKMVQCIGYEPVNSFSAQFIRLVRNVVPPGRVSAFHWSKGMCVITQNVYSCVLDKCWWKIPLRRPTIRMCMCSLSDVRFDSTGCFVNMYITASWKRKLIIVSNILLLFPTFYSMKT